MMTPNSAKVYIQVVKSLEYRLGELTPRQKNVSLKFTAGYARMLLDAMQSQLELNQAALKQLEAEYSNFDFDAWRKTWATGDTIHPAEKVMNDLQAALDAAKVER